MGHPAVLLGWGPARALPAAGLLGADVFVDVWLLDTVSAARKLPIAMLLGGGMEQLWIPCHRDRDRAPILQANAQRVIIQTYTPVRVVLVN